MYSCRKDTQHIRTCIHVLIAFRFWLIRTLLTCVGLSDRFPCNRILIGGTQVVSCPSHQSLSPRSYTGPWGMWEHPVVSHHTHSRTSEHGYSISERISYTKLPTSNLKSYKAKNLFTHIPGSTHLLLFHADPEVTLIKLIWNVPAQWSKFSPLLNQSVKEAQPKQKLPPWLSFIATFKELWVWDGVIEVGAQEVGTQPFRRLIRHLHSYIQENDDKTIDTRILLYIMKLES